MEEEIIGTSGKLVDLFNDNLTQEEWDALCIVHRMSNRLNIGIRFDWNKSIDVRSVDCSQIIDESVFLNKEKNIISNFISWLEKRINITENEKESIDELNIKIGKGGKLCVYKEVLNYIVNHIK